MAETAGVPCEAVAGMRRSPMWASLERNAHTLLYESAAMGDRMAGVTASRAALFATAA